MNSTNAPAVECRLDGGVVPLVERLRLRTLMQHGGPRGIDYGWNLQEPDSEMHRDAANAIERMAAALEWYAEEARACAKNSGSGRHDAPQALLATVAVLALDGGRRADDALRHNVANKLPP